MTQYDFGNPDKIAKDVASLYQSIYEGKKKVDQDLDGDNDGADVMIARMIASGMSREEAIRKVKNKPYNEETELDEAAKRTPKKVRGAKDSVAYMAGRSDAGKRISGDEKTGPRHYTLGRSRGAMPDAPTQPGARPVNTPRLSSSEKEYHQYNKSESKRRAASGYYKVGGPKGLPEEFELWVDSLLDEGYDLSDYTWEEMVDIYEETELEKKKAKEAAIAARRARVAELKAQGRVLTSSKRTSERAKARKAEQRDEKLERVGDELIRKIQNKPTTRTQMGGKAPEPKEAAPEATRRLKTGLKRDTLGKAADDILKGISRREVEVARKANEILRGMKKEEYEMDEAYERMPYSKMSKKYTEMSKDPKKNYDAMKMIARVARKHDPEKAKARSRYKAEEFELYDLVLHLIDEGYDFSDYTWDEVADMLNEKAVDWDTGRNAGGQTPRDTAARRQGQFQSSTNPVNQTRGEQIAKVRANMRTAITKTPSSQLQAAGPIASTRFKNAAIRQRGGSPDSSKIPTVPGLKAANQDAQRRLRPTGPTGARYGSAGIGLADSYDYYDLVLEHLVNEGFADTYELAHTIIEHMSDEWLDEIIEAKKWIQNAIKKPGALSKQLGVPEKENIPLKKLRAAAKKGGKIGKRARLAKTLRKFN